MMFVGTYSVIHLQFDFVFTEKFVCVKIFMEHKKNSNYLTSNAACQKIYSEQNGVKHFTID